MPKTTCLSGKMDAVRKLRSVKKAKKHYRLKPYRLVVALTLGSVRSEHYSMVCPGIFPPGTSAHVLDSSFPRWCWNRTGSVLFWCFGCRFGVFLVPRVSLFVVLGALRPGEPSGPNVLAKLGTEPVLLIR